MLELLLLLLPLHFLVFLDDFADRIIFTELVGTGRFKLSLLRLLLLLSFGACCIVVIKVSVVQCPANSPNMILDSILSTSATQLATGLASAAEQLLELDPVAGEFFYALAAK